MKDVSENAAALVGREFVHFKGGHYRLRGFAKGGETLETIVVYEALYARNLFYWKKDNAT